VGGKRSESRTGGILDGQIQSRKKGFEVKVVVAILAIIVLCLISWGISSSRDSTMENFVAARGETIVESDYRWVHTGPFLGGKNISIYRVETDKSVYWFRFGLWTSIKKEVNGEYIDVE
jgi:hypothetical protein